MTESSKSVRIAVWTLLAGVMLLIAILFFRSQAGRSDLPAFGQVAEFTLTNHLGAPVFAVDLRGKVWVADIIFTRCAGPCPKMTEEMSKLQKVFSSEPNVRFVTLTTDPDYDTPEVLKAYAKKFDADPERWWFLTGSKDEIRKLAIGGLKLTAEEKETAQQENAADLFIHSTIFILVDKQGQLRGRAYESLEPGFQEGISKDIRSLLRER